MQTRVKCPTCGRLQKVPDAEPGQLFLCPACGNKFRVNTPTPVAPMPSPFQQPSAMPDAVITGGGPSQFFYAAFGVLAILFVLIVVLLVLNLGSKHPATPIAAPIASAATATGPTPTSSASFAVARPIPSAGTATPAAAPVLPPPWWAAGGGSAEKSFASSSKRGAEPTAADLDQVLSALSPSTNPATRPVYYANPAWPSVHPLPYAVDISDRTDERIGEAIHRGISYLLDQFEDGLLKDSKYEGDAESAGRDALAVYALLQAGAASNDVRINPHSRAIEPMLDNLKKLPIEHGTCTYAHSLRISALSVYDRAEDRGVLRQDADWLMHAGTRGAYTYDQPRSPVPENATLAQFNWDNSNSQYGALGVWAAAEAGLNIPSIFWSQVQKHWLDTQNPDGQWPYSSNTNDTRLSMTVAGLTMLFVTEDQMNSPAAPANSPFGQALTRGLGWLESGDHSVQLPEFYPTYNLYGLERAALASGFKYFGTHDWYRELGTRMIAQQQKDGYWSFNDPVIDTSFTLLFLSRGRHPIFMNKLRFDGDWENRPRDIANLAHYGAQQLERPLNWQVVSLASPWTDWMDAPILYISSANALSFQSEDEAKLRDYAENGGLIFTMADGNSAAFNRSVADLSQRLFPQYPLKDLPPDHDVYTTLFHLGPPPTLQGVSNGSRLLLLHAPTQLDNDWQLNDQKFRPVPFELGVNIFLYAAGKANLRNKLQSVLVPQPNIDPVAELPVARLSYDGNWDPEPAAWDRFARFALAQTGVHPLPTATKLEALVSQSGPLASLTGTDAVTFTPAQTKAVHDYVVAGGTLLIDACGGAPPFAQSVLGGLLPQAFPHDTLVPLPASSPLLIGNGAGMQPVELKLRPHAAELVGGSTPSLQILAAGKGAILFCPNDLTTGLLGTNTYGVNGLEPDAAIAFTLNTLLWSVNR